MQGEANQLNVDWDIFNVINYSFFGVAVDGSLHSGDYRLEDIYKPAVNQPPEPILHTDVYSSWDLHLLWGELEYITYWPIDNPAEMDRIAAQGFEQNGAGWIHQPSGLTGELPVPLKVIGGAPGIFDLAKQHGAKAMASLGGWSMSKHFPAMAADADMKAKFLADCARLIGFGFDGIDVDWEYPGFGGMNFEGTEADYANFALLMEDIKATVGEGKLVTAAFSGVPEKLEKFVVADSAAALGSTLVKQTVNFAVDGPQESAVDMTNWANYEGTPNYNYLVEQAPELVGAAGTSGWVRSWDSSAQVPFGAMNNFFMSYDDAESLTKKAEYIVDNGLGGIIVWQIHGDIKCLGTLTLRGPKLQECDKLSSPLAEAIDAVFSGRSGGSNSTTTSTSSTSSTSTSTSSTSTSTSSTSTSTSSTST
eukprot:Selendium_serpulae@DN3587_c0_g1_i2.p2